MATMFTKNQLVRLKVHVPEGPVEKFRLDEDTGEVQCLVRWTAADGAQQERWFREDELEAVAQN